jgi:hypothetical protein
MGFRDGTVDYDNTNRGAVFKAKEKRTERSPDRTGELCIQCPSCQAKADFWVSGWLKKARNSGQTFLSLAVNPKEIETPDNNGSEFDDEDIPF